VTRRTGAVATVCAAFFVVSPTVSAAAPQADSAATYPNRPVRVIVPFTPGGQPDIFARMVGEKLTQSLGQQIVVDNRAGAGGMTGSKTVADATPDGHTLLSISSAHAIAPAVRKLPYDTLRDFAGISMLYNAAYLLVVPPTLAVKTVQDLVALARAKPGQLNFGSAGVGSGTHFAAEMFKYAAKIDVVHVAYKGIPEAMTDTMANRVQIFMAPIPSSSGLVKEGKLRALGVTSPARLPFVADIQTIAEGGFPGFRWDSWGGMFAPAKTPRAIVSRLNREVVSILNQPDIQKRMRALGAEPAPTTPAELDKHVAQELAMVFKLAKAAGLEPQ
jgi:tripartite-type tricarboxylate transporter receptor subunit TctC